tara:strand:- start:235 stop:336 length:102 start_codon:yes stop_codon:yes gene_type:complete
MVVAQVVAEQPLLVVAAEQVALQEAEPEQVVEQ